MKLAELFSCDYLCTVTVYRTAGQSSGVGGQAVETMSSLGTFQVMVERLSGGQAQRAFGDQSSSRWRITADGDSTLLVDDVLLIGTGPHAGEYLELNDRMGQGGVLVFAADNTERRPS